LFSGRLLRYFRLSMGIRHMRLKSVSGYIFQLVVESKIANVCPFFDKRR